MHGSSQTSTRWIGTLCFIYPGTSSPMSLATRSSPLCTGASYTANTAFFSLTASLDHPLRRSVNTDSLRSNNVLRARELSTPFLPSRVSGTTPTWISKQQRVRTRLAQLHHRVLKVHVADFFDYSIVSIHQCCTQVYAPFSSIWCCLPTSATSTVFLPHLPPPPVLSVQNIRRHSHPHHTFSSLPLSVVSVH